MLARLESNAPHVWDSPVCLMIWSVWFIRLVLFLAPEKPNTRDRPNRPNEQDRLADFFSILLDMHDPERRGLLGDLHYLS